MTLISGLCFLVNGGIIISCFRKTADILSPARVFSFVWFLAIGLADLKFSLYQSSWTAYSWVVIFLGIASFLVGVFSIFVLYLNRPIVSIQDMRRMFSHYAINQNRLFIAILLVFFGYILSYTLEALILGYIPLFSARPDRARIEFGLFGFHLLVNTMPILLLLIIEYFILCKFSGKKRILLWVMLSATILSFSLILQRFDFVGSALLIISFVYYTSTYLRPSKIWWVGLIFSLLLVAIQNIRITTYVQNYLYVISRMKYSVEYAVFTEPYMYIVMNFENFARAVEKLDVYHYGYFTGDFFLAITGLKHWLADYFHIIDRPYLVSGYNTYPLFWTYYYDFGVLGVGFAGLILGLTVGLIYYWMRTKPSALNVGLYSIVFFVLVISFFTNPLTMLKTNFNTFVWIAVQFFVIPKDHNPTT